jgi:prepilin peptidase CpaA
MTIITMYLLFSMLTVLWFDVRHYLIPNWLVGLLLAVYPVAVWMAPGVVDWKMAVAGMLAVFAVGYLVFAMKWMGAGDVKLITVLSLWVGLTGLADFVFLFAVIGGLFSIALLVARKWNAFIPVPKSGQLPRILRSGEPVPYGVAIASAFLIMLWMGKIPVLNG